MKANEIMKKEKRKLYEQKEIKELKLQHTNFINANINF